MKLFHKIPLFFWWMLPLSMIKLFPLLWNLRILSVISKLFCPIFTFHINCRIWDLTIILEVLSVHFRYLPSCCHCPWSQTASLAQLEWRLKVRAKGGPSRRKKWETGSSQGKGDSWESPSLGIPFHFLRLECLSLFLCARKGKFAGEVAHCCAIFLCHLGYEIDDQHKYHEQ